MEGGQEGGPWVKWGTNPRKDNATAVTAVISECGEPEELG